MNDEMNIYKTRKLIYSIIFNFYENDYSEDIGSFDLVIVESLKNIVASLVKQNCLSEKVKENIGNYLIQAREYQDENRSKRIEFINDIVGIMNLQKSDDSIIFYRLELFKRRKDLKYLFKYPDTIIKSQICNIHDSICNDLYVLISHTEDASKEEFEKEFLPYFVNTDLYYESINAILAECPIIFKDKTFYDRMMTVLDINREIYNNDRKIVKINKQLVKKIKNKVKKVESK